MAFEFNCSEAVCSHIVAKRFSCDLRKWRLWEPYSHLILLHVIYKL